MIKSLRIPCFFACIVLFIASVSSQNLPFPQAKNFSNCIKPTNVSQAQMNRDITEFYDFWKRSYLREAQNTEDAYYIYCRGTGGTGNNITVSEAHGWGMTVFALMDGYDDSAQWYFDGMYWFYDDHRSQTNENLMAWDIVAGEYSPSNGSATDGDMDIAYALILAHHQWGSNGDINYLQEAKDIINGGLEVSCVSKSTNLIMFGDWWNNGSGHENNSRPSDWMTGHLHAYYNVTNNSFWNSLASNLYNRISTFTSNHSPTTGLLSDFYVNGSPPSGTFLETIHDGDYYFNACRTPWRITMDYAHYGTSSAKTVCNKTVNWLKGATGDDPSKIAVGYTLSGTPLDASITSMAFTAPFIAASVVDNAHQSFLNKGWNTIRSDSIGHEYENSLNLLSMLFISGNWWKPGDGNTPFIEPTIDQNGVLFDDFENYYNDDNDQSYLGAAFGYALVNDPGPGGSFWYAFADSSGAKVFNADGVEIGENNAKDMVKDQQMQIKLKTSTSSASYPYAGIGCAILKTGTQFYDFSKMSGITIRAKGSGAIRVEFVTKDIWDLVPANDRWGYHGADIELTGSWKDYKISTHFFAPKRYSPLDLEGFGWLDRGCSGVKEFMISVRDSAKDVELYIDSIFFNGLGYQEAFSFEPKPMNSINGAGLQVNGGCVFFPNYHNMIVTISFMLENSSPVSLSVVDVKGVHVMKPVHLLRDKGIHRYSIDCEKERLSSGVYFVCLTKGEKSIYKKFRVVK